MACYHNPKINQMLVDNRALKRKISCFVEGTMKCDYYLSHQSHEEEEEEGGFHGGARAYADMALTVLIVDSRVVPRVARF